MSFLKKGRDARSCVAYEYLCYFLERDFFFLCVFVFLGELVMPDLILAPPTTILMSSPSLSPSLSLYLPLSPLSPSLSLLSLIVGAPNGTRSSSVESNTGFVYECGLRRNQECTRIPVVSDDSGKSILSFVCQMTQKTHSPSYTVCGSTKQHNHTLDNSRYQLTNM